MSTKKKVEPVNKKAAGKTKGKGATDTEYIEHEAVVADPPPGGAAETPIITAVLEPEPPNLEVMIADEKKKFSLPDTVIKDWETEYGALTIAGPTDTAGYEKVKAAWNYIRSRRTAVEGKGLEIRQRFNALNKAVKSEEERLIELINPLEKKLETLKVNWEKERDRLKAEEKRKEEERLNGRIRDMINLGMVLVDGYYSIGDITTDVATLRTLTDDKYNKLLEKVKKVAGDIAAAKALEEQKRQEEQQELDKQKEAMNEQQRKLNEQAEKMQEQQKQLDEALKVAANAKKEFRVMNMELVGLTMLAAGNRLTYKNSEGESTITVEQLVGLSDPDFTQMLDQKKTEVGALKRQLQERLDREETERQAREEKIKVLHEKMNVAGLQFDYGKKCFYFKNDFLDHVDTLEELLTLDEQGLAAYLNELTDQIDHAKQEQVLKKQKEDAAAEKLRLEKLGDSAKLLDYLEKLAAVEQPKMTSKPFKTHMNLLSLKISGLITDFEKLAEKEDVTHGSH